MAFDYEKYLHPVFKWEKIRKRRDELLAACDYAAAPDYPLDTSKRDELVVYRQALRDLPSQGDDPDAVEWPVKPAFLK